jgi:hypothetical protein
MSSPRTHSNPHDPNLNRDSALSPTAAADFLGIAVSTLANWRTRGIGPIYLRYGTYKIGYRVGDLIDYINKSRVTPGGDVQ